MNYNTFHHLMISQQADIPIWSKDMSGIEKTDKLNKKLSDIAEVTGNLLVDGFHYLALFAIGAATAWSAVIAFLEMVSHGHATIADILLLFIYLELGAMVGIYFKTNHMPVRFLIYVAITALTRLLIGDIQANHVLSLEILYVASAILLLAVANLVIRYSSRKFPYGDRENVKTT